MTTSIITIGIAKGGTGKTVTTGGLASVASAEGKRVLVIDLDPQANATEMLTGELSADAATIKDVLIQQSDPSEDPGLAEAAIMSTSWDNVDLIASSTELNVVIANPDLITLDALRRALDGDFLSDYDYVLIDSAPGQSVLIDVAIEASHLWYAAIAPERFSLSGIASLLATLGERNRTIDGLILTNTIKNDSTGRLLVENLYAHYSDLIVTEIPSRVAIHTMKTFGQPITSLSTAAGKELVAGYSKALEHIDATFAQLNA